MRRRPLEETLLALRRVRQAPEAEESQRELREVLGGEGSHAVARAAALVGERALYRRAALSALASVGGDDALYERAKAVVEARPELKDALARAFGRQSP